MDVTGAMRRAATFFADREAVVHGKDRLTFADAWPRGCRLANGLIVTAGHVARRRNEVTTKRGFSFPSIYSAFATTRRSLSQPPFFVFLAR